VNDESESSFKYYCCCCSGISGRGFDLLFGKCGEAQNEDATDESESSSDVLQLLLENFKSKPYSCDGIYLLHATFCLISASSSWLML